MAIREKHYTVDISKLEAKKVTNVLRVNIFGTPGLSEILGLMKNINKEIDNIQGDYVSITDLSKMNINKFLGSIILRSMESSYKSMISVKRPSLISFVILGDNEYHATTLSETLQTVNQTKLDNSKNYQYRYVYVKEEREIVDIVNKMLYIHPAN